MIAGLAKAVILYLAPLLALTAIVLSFLAFLAPSLLLHDGVALLTITPSTLLSDFGVRDSSVDVDGPSVFLGPLGSCARASNDAPVNCIAASISPSYDLSALPNEAPLHVLAPPAASTPAFIAVALTLSLIFFFTFTLISFRHKMGAKMSAAMEKPLIQRLSAWIGFFGFIIGITSFLIIRMWFQKAVDDFNYIINFTSGAPDLIARIGNAFTMIWVAYAFYGVPLIVSLAKMNTTFTK